MALTELYVDPSINADSGSGTIGDPYGDLEYCLEQEDWDAVNGIRVNIKAGTAELPAVQIAAAMADVSAPGKSVAWTPAIAAPCLFQGYTEAADDGGIAEIDCGGNKSFYNDSTLDYVHFRHLEIHNFGNNNGIFCDNQCSVVDCIMYDSGNTALIDADDQFFGMGNYMYSFGTNAIVCGSYGTLMHNYAWSSVAPDQPGSVSISGGQGSVVINNIVKCRLACTGIYVGNFGVCMHNAVYSEGGTGKGINLLGASAASIIANNLVEGFSGAGGVGIDIDGATSHLRAYGANAVYDCETEYTAQDTYTLFDLGDNEILTASPFTDALTADFSAVDIGNVKEGALPENFGNGNV